jgi:hypothetical protein
VSVTWRLGIGISLVAEAVALCTWRRSTQHCELMRKNLNMLQMIKRLPFPLQLNVRCFTIWHLPLHRKWDLWHQVRYLSRFYPGMGLSVDMDSFLSRIYLRCHWPLCYIDWFVISKGFNSTSVDQHALLTCLIKVGWAMSTDGLYRERDFWSYNPETPGPMRASCSPKCDTFIVNEHFGGPLYIVCVYR